ncbi:UDP-N-acetylglucosamine 2-epimerase [Microbacterium sp. PM5]|uniref:UDP-N-acetylglucosamine 2-epimerase n=1 Tax=Microbacterium sp. PM5 TaxID=2014534 RepID=UPI000DD12867|nr:UDP-N-acetylglucosamine 2-epimerase [Microbacterium sp. PM5]AXA97344.1 hypothetical protein CEP17_13495 [Microbacterium sp. PM5]MDC7803324.1 UDP-N-acetylglucosamine 2-epimerase [Sphingomonas sp. BLCC-B65]
MIIFVYGTTAEAIKLAPVMRRLQERGVPFEQWVTQQHTEALRTAIPQLGLPTPDRVIADGWRGRPLTSPLQMVGWMGTVAAWTLRNLRSERRRHRRHGVVVVHGDTVTTVLGTVIGRLLGLPVAHVEAGLRSGDWRHPFPEELDRRIVGRLASVHYAPSDQAVANLRGRRNVVATHGNTVRDAVRDAASSAPAPELRDRGLVLLHRYEFISQPTLVLDTLRLLDAHSPVPLDIIVDSYSRETVASTIADAGLSRLTVAPKLEHSAFVALLQSARFIVTDSGGIQEEAAVHGVPTLIHRRATERSDGLGSSAVLSGWNPDVVRAFLGDPDRFRVVDPPFGASPSDIVVADLIERGFGSSPKAES